MSYPARQALRFGIGVLVALQLITSLVAIVLLGRMSPAIESILEENVQSVAAVEEMLGTLSASPRTPEERARFESAFQRARANVTESEELPELATVEQRREAAWKGDPESQRQLVMALRALGNVNRGAMQQSDREAQRQGVAGAWAVALLGLSALLLSLLIWRRLHSSLLAPLEEMRATVDALERGEDKRRCTIVAAAGREVKRIMMAINRLLDERQASGTPAEAGDEVRVLPALLDTMSGAVFVVDDAGGLVASNQRALERLAAEDGPQLRKQLVSRKEIDARRLGQSFWLCVLPTEE